MNLSRRDCDGGVVIQVQLYIHVGLVMSHVNNLT